MKTPRFWYQPPGVLSALLAPLGWLYNAATKARLNRSARATLGIPVICVGNINAGGTGKTPTVIALSQRLRDLGHVPHVVSRGHGGQLDGPVEVDPSRHTAAQVGDEPLLIAAFADVWVAKDRASGGQAAEAAGATIVIMDDGFQNPDLHQDLKIVVVDAARGFGNMRCIPAGPLREKVETGLARADALVSIGTPEEQDLLQIPDNISTPRLHAHLRPLETGMDWAGTPYLAFAGIGHPEKFFATLRSVGATLVDAVPLADHGGLSVALLSRLERRANAQGAQLVTTEKDAARLPKSFRGKVLTLPVRLEFEDEAAVKALLSPFPAP